MSPDLRLVILEDDRDHFGEKHCYFLLEPVIFQLCHILRGMDITIVFVRSIASEKCPTDRETTK